MFPQIALHIGAHKTATTHLQRSMFAQADVLRTAGVRFYGPPHFRAGQSIAERFGDDGKAAIAEMAGPAHRVVLSEENFIGTLQSRKGKVAMPLYPLAADRISALASRIAPNGLDVFLSVRNPAHYLTSAFCQALMGGHRVALGDVMALNPLGRVDWAELTDRIAQADGVRSLTVWRYEDYTALFPEIARRMLGADITLPPIDKIVHRGLSADAVAEIQIRYALGKGRKAAVNARERFPIGPDHPPFDAFLPEDHARAAKQYAEQIARIDANTVVTLLRP
ncbi:hypothetical protein SAMN04488515_3636 [Cognatiyoonia koreensis]|uniref:Sulfotransferase family protein n=1 Tax=Cognatiyoonia koreensis TaxID=364200 RepID=A0A1I0S099_9RHOB|nr:hypothetical protein [Cognatiyoonia koreensis]SEW47607.1 hypothetical protein SAMN04488515_3636 [Cognatiyoonia koreensis]